MMKGPAELQPLAALLLNEFLLVHDSASDAGFHLAA
jgi:hypothetical protein